MEFQRHAKTKPLSASPHTIGLVLPRGLARLLDFSCNWPEGQLCALILVSGTTECFSGAPILQWAI
jgi:hypothetical protein